MATTLSKKAQPPATLCDALNQALDAAASYHRGVEEKPAAVLWTDADGQWQPVVSKLRDRLPQLLTLGEYRPEERRGPAIWIKCVMAGTIEIGLPKEAIPVVYLPNVSRQVLRAAADCPLLLQPMVELQYRGTVWTQRNGKDWTVEAFLTSDDALGLDLAKDEATRRSLHAALPVLVDTVLEPLRHKRLESVDFDRLVVGDHPRDLLEWMNDPEKVQGEWTEGKWHAFRSRCREDYGFDPEAEGALRAAERLGLHREESWQGLWNRFCEAPSVYKAIPKLLVEAKPKDELVFDAVTWPDENEKAEGRLRASLLECAEGEPGKIRQRLADFEKDHGPRRTSVWGRQGQAPLAQALGALIHLAERTAIPLSGATPDELAIRYEESGFLADDALLSALACPRTAQDKAAVHAVARALYLPWARSAAETLQQLVRSQPLPGSQPALDAQPGECLLFADGLRFDLGQRLRAICEERGLKVASARRWAALPTVTATAKPAVSPIADLVSGGLTMPEDFAPSLNGQELSTARFRKTLEERGYVVLAGMDTGDPSGKAWTECGSIDARGHDLQTGLVNQITDELDRLADRIMELLDAGWKTVRVVTDHGWLLLPGSLPKVELPGYLLASRWSRCAAIKGQSKVTVPTVAWHWNATAETAVAPGIGAFVAGQDYAHGGVSLQECVIPVLSITRVSAPPPTLQVGKVEWRGLRCRVTVEPPVAGAIIDLRTKANLPGSSVVSGPKPTDASGQASLIVPNEDHAGTAANVVILDEDGHLIARQATTIGEN